MRSAGCACLPGGITPDKTVDAPSKYGGTVLKSSLSKEEEKELQDALHGGDTSS